LSITLTYTIRQYVFHKTLKVHMMRNAENGSCVNLINQT